MIDLFSKLIEKCIELLRERARRRKDVFELVIKPIYDEMPELVDDYLRIFNYVDRALHLAQLDKLHEDVLPESSLSAHQRPQSALETYVQLIAEMREQRQRLNHRRLAVRALAYELKKNSTECNAFANAVQNFFEFRAELDDLLPPSPDESKLEMPKSHLTRTIDIFEELAEHTRLNQNGSLQVKTRFSIGNTIDNLEGNWMRVTIEYSILRRKMLSLNT